MTGRGGTGATTDPPGLPSRTDRFRGVLLGTAVGDALGLPAEGIGRRRARRLFPGPWRHRLLPGTGMLSDDTEHALFVAQSLLAHPAAPAAFTRRLAWCLRGWLLGLPAGVGLATLRAVVRLWLGVPSTRSGVASTGNGPAMRAAPVGAFLAADPDRMEEILARSTRLTHTDPRTLTGARAVALLTAWCVREQPRERPAPEAFAALLRRAASPSGAAGRPSGAPSPPPGDDAEWAGLVATLEEAARSGLDVLELADRLGLQRGVTGYVYHTVPVAVYAWWRHFGDFEATVTSVLDCGGDADTVGAVAGALAGALTGASGIPPAWIRGIRDWPRGTSLLARVADRLAEAGAAGDRQRAAARRAGGPDRVASSGPAGPGTRPTPGAPPPPSTPGPVGYFWPAVPVRNLLFLLVVLAHGFRRLAPPY